MPILLSLPSELIRRIFLRCERFSQVASLAATCKRLHSVYSLNIHSILYPLAQRDILIFDDALITVRATRIVIQHYQRGELPPAPFPLDSLRAQDRCITSEDMREVFDWEHLVNCIENTCLDEALNDEHGHPLRPEPGPTWKRNFRRSVYRLFFIAAVLCRAYQEPFQTSGPDVPNGFLENCWARNLENDLQMLREDEIEHLLKYPVLNFGAYKAHEPVFGALADFLVERACSRANCESSIPAMYPQDAVPTRLDRKTSAILYSETVQCLLAYWLMILPRADHPMFGEHNYAPRPARKVTAVFMHSFLPEEILMPIRWEVAHRNILNRREPLTERGGGWEEPSKFVGHLMACLYILDKPPSDHCTRPPLQVFKFIMRKFLGLRFARDIVVGFDMLPQGSHEFILEVYVDEWSNGTVLFERDNDGTEFSIV